MKELDKLNETSNLIDSSTNTSIQIDQIECKVDPPHAYISVKDIESVKYSQITNQDKTKT